MPPDPAMSPATQPAADPNPAAPPAAPTAAGLAPAVENPAVAAPASAPSPDTPPTPAPVSAPASPPAEEPATAAPAVKDGAAAKPTEAKPAEPEPSLLETLGKKPEVAKPTDAAKAAGDAPADAKADDAKAAKPEASKPAEAAPVEYKYTLPETLKMDDALKGEVHKAFDDFRANPADAQGLIDLHAKSMQEFATQLDRQNREAFANYRKSMRDKVMADPELGGAGHQTAMGAVARMRDLFVPEKDRAEFDDMLRITGAGDHPAMLRLLHNAAKWFDEPAVAPPEARPTKGNGRRPNGGLYSEESRAKMQV